MPGFPQPIAQQLDRAMKPAQFRPGLSAKIVRVPGTAIFLSRMNDLVPPQVVQHAAQLGSLAETVIVLTLVSGDAASSKTASTCKKCSLGSRKMTVRYGFVEIPACRRRCAARRCTVARSISEGGIFSTRDRIVRDRRTAICGAGSCGDFLSVPQLGARGRNLQLAAGQFRRDQPPDPAVGRWPAIDAWHLRQGSGDEPATTCAISGGSGSGRGNCRRHAPSRRPATGRPGRSWAALRRHPNRLA